MAKVYVSSTVADLKRERRAVMDWLRAARHQAVDSYLPGSDTCPPGSRTPGSAADRPGMRVRSQVRATIRIGVGVAVDHE